MQNTERAWLVPPRRAHLDFLREVVFVHLNVWELLGRLFNLFRMLLSFRHEIWSKLVKVVDVQNIGLLLEHARCSEQPGVETMMKVALLLVTTELFYIFDVLFFNAF
jgi:hypothetical protein